MASEKSMVVLISGSGSNLQAIIDQIHLKSVACIQCVISNRPDAYGLERAKRADIPTRVVDHTKFEDRQGFDQKLIEVIEPYHPDLLILAGFMRILTDGFIEHFRNKIINIHPSLLPRHKGLHTHQKVLDAGDKMHGATIHLVTPTLDNGPIIAQTELPVYAHDTRESLAQRVLLEEHKLFPRVIKAMINREVRISVDGQICGRLT